MNARQNIHGIAGGIAPTAPIASAGALLDGVRPFTTRITRSRSRGDASPAALQPLEARRLMSASAFLDGDTLVLRGEREAENELRVEIDATGGHVRGVVNGQTSPWRRLSTVQRIAVSGSDVHHDTLQLDSRLQRVATRLQVDANVDRVDVRVVRHDDAQQTQWADEDARRLSRELALVAATAEVEFSYINVEHLSPPAYLMPRVERVVLIDARTNQPVPGFEQLADGTVIDLARLPGRDLNIRLDVFSPGGTFEGSIAVELGDWRHVENWFPYAVFGDNDGDYNAWTPKVGVHTLKATVFTERLSNGVVAGTSETRFIVVDSELKGDEKINNRPNYPVNDPAGPQAKLDLLTDRVSLGHAIHVSGMDTSFTHGMPHEAVWEWDFGDPGSEFNVVRGFVAAHHYTRPGQYTVTLRVTDADGRVGQASATVSVVAASRTQIFVSSSGNDSRSGLGPDQAVRSVARALQLMDQHGDGVEILFRRGQTHDVDRTISVTGSDVVIGAYGSGDKPLLVWSGGLQMQHAMVQTGHGSSQVVVRDLAFHAPGPGGYDRDNRPSAIRGGGEQITILNNTFYDITDGLNANGRPTGVLFQGNSSPTDTGLRAYLVWGEGRQLTVLGNHAANSTREHILRFGNGGVEGVTIAGNHLANIDRRMLDDPYDFDKSTVNLQRGSWGYVSDNQLVGPAQVGPLGRGDGLKDITHRWHHAVWENNFIRDNSLFIYHGTKNAEVRGNLIHNHNGVSIVVEGFEAAYQRTVRNVSIDGNIGFNNGDRGQFLSVYEGAREIAVTNNTFVAPNLVIGNYGSAGMAIRASDLSSFSRIDGNVWPSADNAIAWVDGGVNIFERPGSTTGYIRPAEWNNLPKVGNDSFVNADTSLVVAFLNEFGVPASAVPGLA